MKTRIVIEVEHDRDIPHLADMVAGRAWSINGVKSAEVVQPADDTALQRAGFTHSEIALGRTEIERGT